MVNLNQLYIFHVVAENMSFTRAAAVLHLTQPGVSKHVKQLEEYYGVRVFERQGKTIMLTEAGLILLEATRQILRAVSMSKKKIKELKGAPPTLALVATFTAGLYIVPRLLASFRASHPLVSTTLEILPANVLESRVVDQSFDIGLVGHDVKDRRLVCTEFFSEELVAVVPPRHPWSIRKSGVAPGEFEKEIVVLPSVGSGTRQIVQARLRENGVKLKNVLDFGNLEAVKKAVEAGLGVSIMTKGVIKREVAAGLLWQVPLAGKNMKRRFASLTRKQKPIPPIIKEFVQHLAAASG